MTATSSARPARLVRHADTAAAIDEGLRTRFAVLDEALAAYRATCEQQYRMSPTAGTTDVLRLWSGGIADLGRWTRDVGNAFIATQVLEIYMTGYGSFDPEDAVTLPDDSVVGHMDEFQDDPFLGVPPGGWAVDGPEVSAEDPQALADFLGDLGLASTISDATLGHLLEALESTPRAVPITIRLTETSVLFLADGRVIHEIIRTEAPAYLLLPGQVPDDLARAGRWLGRVNAALDFAGGAYEQWQEDAGISVGDRVLRATTRGGGVALGSGAGGWLGGLAGGATAGLVCGPGAPVCSGVLGIGGAILGAIGGGIVGDWLTGFLPWMDDHEPPKPGEYDLDELRDQLGQEEGGLSEHFWQLDAATSLIAHDLAMAETSDQPDVQAHLEDLLPDRDELVLLAQGLPLPDEITPTGTTTPHPEPGPTEPAEPSPGPSPQPQPAPTPSATPSAPPTGTTVPQG